MFILLLPTQLPWGKWGLSKALLCKVALAYLVALLGLNIRHQFNFRSPQAFWEQAAATTPHLGHSKAMLSFQITDSIRALHLLQEAYKLDTNERYIHMNLARVYYQLHQYQLAEQHILIEDTLSKDLRCRYFKSRLWLQKGDTAAAIVQMKAYIKETNEFVQKRIVDEQIDSNENCFELNESILPGTYIVEINNTISSHRTLLIKQ
jgi:tetratricopeptide (TPR) repeat protein